MSWKKILSPFSFLIIVIWGMSFFYFDLWNLFKNNFFMPITMIFGSIIAGATSEGGGAVAFPVMTLLFDIKPSTARDFSLLIQSVGMVAASFVIVRNKIPVLFNVVATATLGSVLGFLFGIHFLNDIFSSASLKIIFCSFWLSFIFVLFMTDKDQKKFSRSKISLNWKSIFLIISLGFFGGLITFLTGTGVDILLFSLLTLYFKVCIKIATPTSVLLMAINSLLGAFIKSNSYLGLDSVAFEYFLICIPVVLLGAPLGSLIIEKMDKAFVTWFLILSITCQFIGALFILDLKMELIQKGILTFLFGLGLFYFFSRSNPKSNVF